MKILFKISLIFLVLAFIIFWHWAEMKDYFKENYKDLRVKEQAIFKLDIDSEIIDNSDNSDLTQIYESHFTDTAYRFPRQSVSEIKVFRNIPLIGGFTSRKLKPIYNDSLLNFCNDPDNFSWAETTWNPKDAEYLVRLYDNNGLVVGKIYFCLSDCGMTNSRPFCPSMKFGGLSENGMAWIEKLFKDKTKWE